MLPVSPVYLLFYLPLLLAVSIVYGGTRHEDPSAILRQSLHTAYWITAFMGVIFVVLLIIGWLI